MPQRLYLSTIKCLFFRVLHNLNYNTLCFVYLIKIIRDQFIVKLDILTGQYFTDFQILINLLRLIFNIGQFLSRR